MNNLKAERTLTAENRVPDDRLERVIKGLPGSYRPDGYPRQTMVQVAWLRDVLIELQTLRSREGTTNE